MFVTVYHKPRANGGFDNPIYQLIAIRHLGIILVDDTAVTEWVMMADKEVCGARSVGSKLTH